MKKTALAALICIIGFMFAACDGVGSYDQSSPYQTAKSFITAMINADNEAFYLLTKDIMPWYYAESDLLEYATDHMYKKSLSNFRYYIDKERGYVIIYDASQYDTPTLNEYGSWDWGECHCFIMKCAVADGKYYIIDLEMPGRYAVHWYDDYYDSVKNAVLCGWGTLSDNKERDFPDVPAPTESVPTDTNVDTNTENHYQLYFDTEYDINGIVYIMPDELMTIRIKNSDSNAVSTIADVNRNKEQYKITLDTSNDPNNLAGLVFNGKDTIKFTKKSRAYGIAGVLKLVDINSGVTVDERKICYCNAYREGWFNLGGYVGQVSRYKEIAAVTDNKGLILYQSGLDELEIVNVVASELKNDNKELYPEGYYVVTFEALNGTSIYYGVEVTDKEGQAVASIDTVLIPPYSSTTPFCKVMYEGGKILLETLTFNLEKGYREVEKNKTEVSINVPNGGSILFVSSSTNDEVRAANIVEMFMGVVSLAQDGKKIVQGITKKQTIDSDMLWVIDRRGMAEYLMRSGLYQKLLNKAADSKLKKLSKEVLTAFITENYTDIEDALKQFITPRSMSDPLGTLTMITATLESTLVQLNPAAYAAETFTQSATDLEKCQELIISLSEAENPLKLKEIVMPYKN